jgi:hypothetical protein
MILTQKIKKALFYKAFRRRSVYSTVKNPGGTSGKTAGRSCTDEVE